MARVLLFISFFAWVRFMAGLIREYFKAKSIPYDKLPFLRHPNMEGNKQIALFEGGIVVFKMEGKGGGGFVRDLPFEARLINRRLNANIFKFSDGERIKVYNHNGTVILVEIFGDVALMWFVPNPIKIYNLLKEKVNGYFKAWEYVNHGFIINFFKVEEITLTEINKDQIKLHLRKIETFLNTEFISLVKTDYQICGSDDLGIFLKNEEGFYRFNVFIQDDLKDKLVDLSSYSINLVEQIK